MKVCHSKDRMVVDSECHSEILSFEIRVRNFTVVVSCFIIIRLFREMAEKGGTISRSSESSTEEKGNLETPASDFVVTKYAMAADIVNAVLKVSFSILAFHKKLV